MLATYPKGSACCCVSCAGLWQQQLKMEDTMCNPAWTLY
jgi:hypothetical protein